MKSQKDRPIENVVEQKPHEHLDDVPPSAKLVYKILEYEGSMTQSQLTDATMLSGRTVRYALTDLEERGLVEEEFYFADARKNLYSLATATDGSTATE